MPVKTYAIIGESQANYQSDKLSAPVGMIEMQSRRPDEGTWTAQADGTWKEDVSSARIAEIDAEITALETKQLRPTREWILDSTNAIAAEAVQTIETQLIALREERALLLAA